ncbi:MAG TPA: histidinol-phosphate transaminase [Terriglobia bacterium]|nr:histidinol-phosphate transaminase [Terriglobia bacterium]
MSFSDIIPPHIQRIPPYKSENPAEEMERELGVKVVQLGMNENPFGASPKAVEAARAYMDQVAPYPDDTGFFLRKKLAAHYKISMDELVISTGSSDILAMAYHAVFAPGAEVITGESSFVVYYQLADMLNMPIVRVPMKNYAFDLDAIAERITSKTALVVLANPNNPTGTLIRQKELDAFMKKVPDQALVILDEAYFEYVREPDYPNSLEYVRAGRPVLILRTFSKVFGLAGLRIGYGIGTKQVIDTLYKVRMAFNTSSVAQVAALAAWDDHAHIEKSITLNRQEREFLYSELSKRGLKYVPSYTNFVLVDVGRPGREVTTALLNHGVIVRPAWGCPTCMRVSVGTHEQNERFVSALDKVL